MPLRPPSAKLSQQRPLWETQSDPCAKNSSSASVAARIFRISGSDSSRARIIRRNPAFSRKTAFYGVRLCVWVLAKSGIGGRSASSNPISCMMTASAPASQRRRMSLTALSSSASVSMVFTAA